MRGSREPRWTTSSKDGWCSECTGKIEKDDKILVVPERGLVLCNSCGDVRAPRYGVRG